MSKKSSMNCNYFFVSAGLKKFIIFFEKCFFFIWNINKAILLRILSITFLIIDFIVCILDVNGCWIKLKLKEIPETSPGLLARELQFAATDKNFLILPREFFQFLRSSRFRNEEIFFLAKYNNKKKNFLNVWNALTATGRERGCLCCYLLHHSDVEKIVAIHTRKKN